MHSQASDCLKIITYRAAVPFKASNQWRSRTAPLSLICRQMEYSGGTTRRETVSIVAIATLLLPGLMILRPNEAQGIGFKKELKKRKVDLSDYTTSRDGLKFADLSVGTGDEVSEGKRVTVHFDCIYKGVNVVSSRQARLLGGNRTISEPFEFTAGEAVAGVAAKKISDSANGLFAGAAGPKPPSALGTAVLGMRVGGKRSVIVPPELGYGKTGLQEIPPNEPFEMRVEVLQVG